MRTKTEITVNKIVDAAYDLYVEHGFFNVSMKDIQQASGVSNGSIFHHFKSKDHIIVAAYIRERRTYWNTVFEAMEAWQGDPPTALGEAVRASLRYQETFRKQHKFMIECGALNRITEIKGPVQALNDEFYARFYAWAQPHLKAGTLALLQPELYSAIIFGPAQWVGRAWASGQSDKPPTDYAEELAGLVTGCFRP